MEQSQKPTRYRGIDAARGFAALMVLVAHCIEQSDLAAFKTSSTYFHPGAGGVYLFFLISGFVIPLSVERVKGVREFAIGRIFRLYPLFLASMTAALISLQVGVSAWMSPKPIVTSALFNLTMVQEFLGYPSLIGGYWTLGYELIFYVLVGILLGFGAHKKLYWLSVALSSVVLLLVAWALVSGKSHGGDRLVGFVFMFLGTAYYAQAKNNLTKKQVAVISVLALGSLCAHFVVSILLNKNTLATWAHIPTSLVALTAFILTSIMQDSAVPKMLVFFGQISYSTYLVHGVVLRWVAPKGYLAAPIVHLAAVALITIAISTVTYRCIEKPGIRLGKKLIARLEGQVVTKNA